MFAKEISESTSPISCEVSVYKGVVAILSGASSVTLGMNLWPVLSLNMYLMSQLNLLMQV